MLRLAPLLFLLLPRVVSGAPADPVALLMSGESCPDPAIARVLRGKISGARQVESATWRVSSAVARVRATQALAQARRLYTRTNFAGCVSLLSISELELGRTLAESNLSIQDRSHRLLARVMLWLGICQWASGEPQSAAASFIRSAQLPGGPTPDPDLLPPALVKAYREAMSAPRRQVDCILDPPLQARHLLIDGKGPTTSARGVIVPGGAHNLVIKVSCGDGDPACLSLKKQVGPRGMRSLRLETAALRCRIQLPASAPESPPLTCINPSEATKVSFVSGVTREAQAGATLVVDLSGKRVTTRLHRAGFRAFQHQLVSNLRDGERPATVVSRSVALLLGGGAPAMAEITAPARPPPVDTPGPWYRKWWVWALAGTAAAAIITSSVLATRDNPMQVVFGR